MIAADHITKNYSNNEKNNLGILCLGAQSHPLCLKPATETFFFSQTCLRKNYHLKCRLQMRETLGSSYLPKRKATFACILPVVPLKIIKMGDQNRNYGPFGIFFLFLF